MPGLYGLFQECRERGHLSYDMTKATIVVFLKQGRDPRDWASYRPISLLNSEVKTLAKILANRLYKVAETLINPDQCGFMHKRSTRHNLRRLYNVEDAAQDGGLSVQSLRWTPKRRLALLNGLTSLRC